MNSASVRTLLFAIFAAMTITTAQAEPLRVTIGTVERSDHNAWLAKQLRCLITVMYTEARGESEYGQALTARAVMNRFKMRPQEWGDSPCKVAFQIRITKRGGLVSQFAGPIHHMMPLRDDDAEFLRLATLAVKVYLGSWQPKPEHACVVAYQRIEHANASSQPWFAGLRNVGKVDHHTFYCLPQTRTVVASR